MRARLCLATDSREPSGLGEHMLALGEALVGRYEVALACPASPGGLALLERAARAGLRAARIEADEVGGLGTLDLLHVHAGVGWEGHGLAAAGRRAAVPRVVRTEHLPDVITDPGQRRAHRAGLGAVDRLVCVSAAAAASFRALGIEPGKLVVVRNGLPDRPATRSRATVRAAFGLDDRRRVMVTVARFTPQKNHALLVEALPGVLAHHPGAECWLAGAGMLEGEVRRRVDALGLGGAVRFLGARGDVPDLLAGADLFVLPSRFEGLPLAVLEAMAAGLPVVATRVGGTDEAVVDGVTGHLVEPDALGPAITAVLDDGTRARALGLAGRARFLEAFTAARMADETARVYADLGVPPDR